MVMFMVYLSERTNEKIMRTWDIRYPSQDPTQVHLKYNFGVLLLNKPAQHNLITALLNTTDYGTVTIVALIFYSSALKTNGCQPVGEGQLLIFLKTAYGIGNEKLTCDSKAVSLDLNQHKQIRYSLLTLHDSKPVLCMLFITPHRRKHTTFSTVTSVLSPTRNFHQGNNE
jgi:hypothetical protein